LARVGEGDLGVVGRQGGRVASDRRLNLRFARGDHASVEVDLLKKKEEELLLSYAHKNTNIYF
jgi:hypothetical protein